MASPVAAACTHKLKFLTGIVMTRPCWGHVAAMAACLLFLLEGFAFLPSPPTSQYLCLHLGNHRLGHSAILPQKDPARVTLRCPASV